MSPRFRAAAAALVLLGGCTADPGEVARVERKALSSVAVVGAPFADVGPALAAKGYDCRMSRGNFTAESGTSSSAPAFMRCNGQTKPVRRCSIGTQIVVVPKAGVIEQVHFFAGNACMRAK